MNKNINGSIEDIKSFTIAVCWVIYMTIGMYKLGLIFNFIGTIFIALSFGPLPEDSTSFRFTDEEGIERAFVHVKNLKMFYQGIVLLIFGFFIQILEL